MLRFFERVRHEVGRHAAEAQVDAAPEQGQHLIVDDAGGVNRQVSRRRQLDDAAVDQHAGRWPAYEHSRLEHIGQPLVQVDELRDRDAAASSRHERLRGHHHGLTASGLRSEDVKFGPLENRGAEARVGDCCRLRTIR